MAYSRKGIEQRAGWIDSALETVRKHIEDLEQDGSELSRILAIRLRDRLGDIEASAEEEVERVFNLFEEGVAYRPRNAKRWEEGDTFSAVINGTRGVFEIVERTDEGFVIERPSGAEMQISRKPKPTKAWWRENGYAASSPYDTRVDR